MHERHISNLSDASECGSCEEVVGDKTAVGCGNRVQQYTWTCELGRRSSRSTSDSRHGQRRCGHLHWIQPLTDTLTLHTHYLASIYTQHAPVFLQKDLVEYDVRHWPRFPANLVTGSRAQCFFSGLVRNMARAPYPLLLTQNYLRIIYLFSARPSLEKWSF